MAIDQKAMDACRKAEDSPVAWFAVLCRACESGDLDLLAKAVFKLRRLGIQVRYRGICGNERIKGVRYGH